MKNIDLDYVDDQGGWLWTDTFKTNKTNPKGRSWVVDDFYENPDDIREFALRQFYTCDSKEHGGVGCRTRKQFLFDDVKEQFEKIMGKKITKWRETYGICGVFQYGTAGIPKVYHVDAQQYAAMVFLTPNAPYQAGTKIVANKKNGIYHSSQGNPLEYFPQQETFTDGTLFEDVDVFGNVYNRCVIFDGKAIHTAGDYFGHDINSGRLWQMFFFDAE
jgi:hypothetical protein|tara:strand:- start:220 stop:870 length:651 start_codon:yes stop_codon:yes gene_type:complete